MVHSGLKGHEAIFRCTVRRESRIEMTITPSYSMVKKNPSVSLDMGRYGAYAPHTVEYQIYRGEATDISDPIIHDLIIMRPSAFGRSVARARPPAQASAAAAPRHQRAAARRRSM